jgi:hypothetical protein
MAGETRTATRTPTVSSSRSQQIAVIRRRRLRLAACASVAIPAASMLLRAHSAKAATQYWDINGNGTWNITATDWSGNSTGTGGTGDVAFGNGSDVVFSTSAVNAANITITTTNVSANSTTFSGASATNYTFTNAGTVSLVPTATGATVLTMASGSGNVTFNGPIIFGTNTNTNVSFTFANNSSSPLTFNGSVSNDNNTGADAGTGETINLTGNGTGGVTFSAIYNTNNTATNRPTALVINTNSNAVTALTSTLSTFNGGTTVTQGILSLTANNVLGSLYNSATAGSGGALTVNGGTVLLNGTSQNVGALAGTGGTIYNNGNGSQSLLTIGAGGVGTTNASTSFAGVIEDNNGGGANGTVALSKVGTGTLTLTAVDTYSGATSVTGGGGGLYLSGNGTIANTSAITIGAAGQATSTLTYDNSAAGTGTTNRLGSAAITIDGGTLAYKGITTGNVAGTGSAGAITLGGSQTSFFNFTAASGGNDTSTFTISSLTPGAHSTLSASLASANASTDRIVVTTAPTLINGILPWTIETSNTNFLTVASSPNYLGAYGSVSGTDVTTFGNISTENVKITSAQSALSGNDSENSLVYQVGATQGLGGHTLTLTSGGLLLGNASAVLGSSVTDGSITTAAANPELYVDTSANATINSPITDAAGSTSVALTKFGTGTLTLAGASTYSGATTIEQGTLTIAATGNIAASSGTTVLTGATLTLNGGSTTGAITDNGAVTIAGTTAVTTGNFTGASGATGTITTTNTAANTLTFAGSNSLATITDSQTTNPLTLAVSNSAALTLNSVGGSSGSTVIFGGDGTGNTSITGAVSQAGQLFKVTAGNVTLGNERNTAEAFEVDGGTLILNNTRYSNVGNNTFAITGGTVQLNANGTYGFRANGDSGPGSGGPTNSTWTGNQTGGVLSILSTGAGQGLSLGSTTGNSTVTNVTTYNLSGGNVSTNYVDLGADTSGYSTTTLNFSGGRILASGAIEGVQGAGAKQAFVWTGGTLTTAVYTATNLTSTSGTAVSASTNTLTNAGGILAPGFVGTTFTSGYTNGTQYTGRTTITGNYTVTSGNASLVINIGGNTSAPSFGSPSTDYDNVIVTGNTTLGGNLTVGLIGNYIPASNATFTIFTDNVTGGLSGSFTDVISNKLTLANGATFSVTDNNTTIILGNYTAPSLTWSGTGNVWDINTTSDWYQTGGSTPSTFANGDAVTFDNTGIGNSTVNLNTPVVTAGITFNNTSGAYLITGSGNITGASLSVSGNGGTAILAVPATITAGTTIASGATLQLGNATATGSIGNSTVTDNGSLIFNRTNAVAQGTDFGSAAITGSGSVTQEGTGSTVTFSTANTFTGGLNLNGGTVAGTVAGAFGGSSGAGNISVGSGATAGLNGGTFTYANPITFQGSGATLTLGNSTANGAPTFSGNITGSGNLTAAATGTGATTISGIIGSSVGVLTQNTTTSQLNLTGNNTTWGGGLTIAAGTVNASTANDALGTGTLTLGTGSATTTLDYSNGGVSSFAYTNPISVGGNGTATIETDSGQWSDSGSVTLGNNLVLLNKNGAGTNLSLTGNITGSANVTLTATSSGGQFVLGGGNNSLATTGNLILNSTGTGGLTVTGNLNNTGNITNTAAGSGTAQLNANIGTNVGSVIQNSATSSTLIGATNTGNNSVTTFVVDQGTLKYDAGNANTRYLTGSITLNAGPSQTATLTTNSSNGPNTGGLGDGGVNTIYVTGNGTNIVTTGNGNDDFEGPVVITEGDSLTVDPVTNDGRGFWNFAGNTSSTTPLNSITSQGSGSTATVLTLENNMTANATLVVGTVNIVGSVVNAATHVDTAATNTSIAGVGANVIGITQNSTSFNNLIILGNNSASTATYTVTAGTLQAGTTTAFNANNVVTVTGGTFDLGNFSNTIAGLSDGNVTTGVVTNSGSGVKTLTLGGNGTFSYGGNITATTPSNLALTVALTGGSQTLNGSNSYAGGTTITGGTLFANNAFSSLGTGNVTINGGELAGNGTIANASHSISVNNGGTIGAGGSASVAGNLTTTGTETWKSGGTYAWKITGANQGAGNSGVAVGSGGSGTIGSGSGVEGSDWDLLTMSGLSVTATVNSPFTIALTANNPPGATNGEYSWVIAQTGSTALPNGNITAGDNLLSGGSNPADAGMFALNTNNFTFGGVSAPSQSLFSVEFEPIGSGGDFDLVLDYNYNSAPEPGTGLLVLTGGLPMLLNRRRRRKPTAC